MNIEDVKVVVEWLRGEIEDYSIVGAPEEVVSALGRLSGRPIELGDGRQTETAQVWFDRLTGFVEVEVRLSGEMTAQERYAQVLGAVRRFAAKQWPGEKYGNWFAAGDGWSVGADWPRDKQ
ncbi:MAG: hypothetical protein KDE24_17875 [Caldilinea sp.]|nr:hypothetical protein [Caldilinea sp.]